MDTDRHFEFGKNWQEFLKSFDLERVEIAKASLTEFLDFERLEGLTFLDIGCGSGLFSYAAHELGASCIVSFDTDPFSVACCEHLRSEAGKPSSWQVLQASVLDESLPERLGTFDIVYSWGVLHHTGRMWDAIRNAMRFVTPGGYFYIALYNKILTRDGRGAHWIHPFWIRIKKTYNARPGIAKYILTPAAKTAYIAMVLAKGENPIAHVRNYKSHRGMSWHTDATDWLGGYPYEFATTEEVFRFVRADSPVFHLINLKVTGGRGLNWYLFRRKGD
jgi:2-polyprenyl-6-hydroxyphenyl methylase/3-demethylubiquinone-9 3-methyltransferase